ncbi:MAG TPA: hypothetical protein VMT18_07010, partial [Planctomycetota bacterium]|nr:hypothetical protein [Planctomycetota bacterium]
MWLALIALFGLGLQDGAVPEARPRRAISRERLLDELEQIVSAAQRLEELGVDEEALRVVARIRNLARALREDLDQPPQAADGAAERATAGL